MTSKQQAILNWLSAIPQTTDEPVSHMPTPKRRRLDHARLLSPPPSSVMPETSEPTLKRPHDDAVDHDADATPRYKTGLIVQPASTPPTYDLDAASLAASSSPSKVSRTSTTVSRTSSPSKQIKLAELDDTGYVVRSFTRDKSTIPGSLKDLTKRLVCIQEKENIFPEHVRNDLADLEVRERWFAADQDGGRGGRDRGWEFPPRSFIDRTVDRAIECSTEQEGECSWNQDVHRPILEWVFRNPSEPIKRLDFRYCTSATIVPKFKPRFAPSKMVDYCVHFLPEADENTAITALRRMRPSGTINHTDWGNLARHPIAFSIETKRDGEGLATATAQIGTWHSAQWRSLLHEKGHLPPNINFLPAFVVQGHMWFFVATTLDHTSQQGQAYFKIPVGSTETVLGAYQVLLSLKCLKDWAEDEYWPAFRSYMLGLA